MAKGKAKVEVSPLEAALDFLSIGGGFAELSNGFARSFDMVVGTGCTVQEDLVACPQIDLLRTAISRCGQNYTITQLSLSKLLVRSGEFHAYIPCANRDSLSWCVPDAAMGMLGDDFMSALAKVAPLANTVDESVLRTSIQLNNGSVIATNGGLILEAWHGHSFPDGLLLPKSSYNALKKAKKKIVSFGFSSKSLTIYFDDQSWFFTKLYQDKWPSATQSYLVGRYPKEETRDIPSDFFAAVRKVEPFSADCRVYVNGNRVSSHPFDAKEEGSALALEFSGDHLGRIYDSKNLLLAARHVEKWDENAGPHRTHFIGDNIRGSISHEEIRQGIHTPFTDDDIPF